MQAKALSENARGKKPAGCPIEFALRRVGDHWSLLIVRDLAIGGKQRYSELLARNREGISTNILAQRLQCLDAAGIVREWPHRYYRTRVFGLTPAGQKLVPVLAQLGAWSVWVAHGKTAFDKRMSYLASGNNRRMQAFLRELRAVHSSFQPLRGFRRPERWARPVLESLEPLNAGD